MINTEALKRKIVDLAVTGELTESSSGDANKELERIINKLNSNTSKVKEDDFWAVIPRSWAWAKLSNLTTTETLNDGDWVLSVDMVPQGEVKLIQLGSIGDCVFKNSGFKYLTKNHFDELNGKQIYPGYLLVNRLVMNRMASCIVPELDGVLMTAVDVCWIAPNDEAYNIKYIMYALSSSGFQKKVNSLGRGVTRFRISKLNLIEIPFPLPPREEQDRIIKKIDELFSLTDKMEKLKLKYNADAEVLKSKIIDASIQGKLTEQLYEDGNAEDLLAEIQAEKKRLYEEGKIPKDKKLPSIPKADEPFKIPNSWKWTRIQDVASYITDYVANGSFATLKEHTKTYKEKNYAVFVRTMDLGAGFKEECSYIDKESYEFLHKSKLFGGELILPNIGASIGKVFIMPDLGMPMSLAPNSILLKFVDPVMNEYFSLVFKSSYGSALLNKSQGGSATAKFSKTDLRAMAVPVPPIEEQKRIVDITNMLLEELTN